MTVNTRHPRKKSAIGQGTAIIGRNGLPVDTCVSFDASIPILENVGTSISYASPTVTVNAGVDLTTLVNREYKNTQILAFTDAKGKRYYIDRNTINDGTKTFDIYTNFDATDPLNIAYNDPPATVETSSDWSIHELKWVNRLAVADRATIIENVEFGKVDMQLSLSGKKGDSVRIVDSDGDELDVQPDGSINVNANINVDTEIEIDAKDGDNIAISAHPIAQQIFQEAEDTITTALAEEIFSYTSANNNTRLLQLECTVSTDSVVDLKINGVIKRRKITSPLERNVIFKFEEHRPLLNGQSVTIEARVLRKIKNSYYTFTSLEAYLCEI